MNARRGIVPLVAVVVGLGLMVWSFLNGIAAALDGSGNGSLAYQVVFIAAAVLVLVALVIAVINLVRGDSRVLAVITIIVAFLPIVGVIIFAIAANQPYPST